MKTRMNELRIIGTGQVLIRVLYFSFPSYRNAMQKMSPDMRRKVDASRMQRVAAENAVQKQLAAQAQVSFFCILLSSLALPFSYPPGLPRDAIYSSHRFSFSVISRMFSALVAEKDMCRFIDNISRLISPHTIHPS